MNLDIEKYGKAFVESVQKVLDIREKKRKEYGDTYMEDTPDFLLMQVKNKLKRIWLRLESEEEINETEKIHDNIFDAIVYLHFLNIVLNKK